MKTFEELGIIEPIRHAIEELGFVQPMPVQEEVIPFLLREQSEETAQRQDLIALAQTGTGKTAAFGIPLLQYIDSKNKVPQALVLSPTRELCLQISDDIRDFARYMDGVRIVAVYGGTSIVNQIHTVERGVQVVVATPGRLIDLVKRGALHLDQVRTVVLDEADEMLNMGFKEDIDQILSMLPENRTTLLFSATMSREIERIARTYLRNPEEIVVGSRNEGAENVNHIYYMVAAKDRYLALKRVVDYFPRIYAIIFCRTKRETQEIADKLIRDGYNAEPLHGDLSQQQRDITMQKFRQHLTQLLVATDVAARGLDVDDLTHVINFSLPDDIESYTHRSGRTGRAGKRGTSIAIVHSREKRKMRDIEREIGKQFEKGTIPTPHEICTKQLYRVMDQISKTDVDEEQIAPFMAEINRHFEFMEKEDIIKKIVSSEFGKFLAYYADAPEIEIPESREQRKTRQERQKGGSGTRKVEKGFARLFINLGKDDGFYPGEIMQFINHNVHGPKITVGHIDLLPRQSYIEVPEEDAPRVMNALSGTRYKGRPVWCNDAAEGGLKGKQRDRKADKGRESAKKGREKNDWNQEKAPRKADKRGSKKQEKEEGTHFGKNDWMRFFLNADGSPRGGKKGKKK